MAENQQASYPNPPIIEAIIEFRYTKEIEEQEFKKLSDAFSRHYSEIDEQVEYDIKYDLNTNKVDRQERKGVIMSLTDQSRALVIKRNSLISSIRAPYTSYEDFESDAVRMWDISHEVLGFRKLARVGMRYINRIDLLMNENLVNYEEYLNLRINLPENFEPITSYNMNFTFNIDRILSNSRIISLVKHDIVLNHASFFLDIDVGRSHEVPQRQDKVFELLREMRIERNRLFEEFITDKSRALFDAK